MRQRQRKKDPLDKIITIPNILSTVRLCLIPLFVWLYMARQAYWPTAGVLLLSAVTDVVDGFIARKFHMISNLGKILDPIADKLTQAAMMICLVFRFPLLLIPMAVMLVKEIYMSVSGSMVIQQTGLVLGAQWHGKAATVLLYIAMVLHVLWPDIPFPASAAVIGLCTFMIILSFVLYAIRNTRALKGKLPPASPTDPQVPTAHEE